uniref:Uncharacterized protein n=1 Tax=Romanomermis culicivorax TaxID=13658 RepID=A0A915JWJ6_ROMCU
MLLLYSSISRYLRTHEIMDVIVGSNTGVLKGEWNSHFDCTLLISLFRCCLIPAVNLVDNTCTNLNFSTKLNKQDETVALCWSKCRGEGGNENSMDDFLCAQLNRQVKLCHCSKDGSLKSEKLETLFTCSGGEGRICGLEMVNR